MLRQNSKGEWMILIQFFREEKENRENLLNRFMIKTEIKNKKLVAISKTSLSISDSSIK